MYVQRTLEKFINDSARNFPVLFLTGARQVGKTTCLRNLAAKERSYVSLDDPLVLNLAKEDPALFMQRFPPPVMIDEIQYAPELLPYIKMKVDRERKPGSFWVTGSQHFHLMKGISETLTGRVGILSLLGLSRKEMLGLGDNTRPFLPDPEIINKQLETGDRLDLKKLYKLIWRGTFPEVTLHNELDWNLFYSSYVQTYMQRDIRDLAKVGNEMAFLRFLRASAARTGQLLNMSDLARDADISSNTAKNWLSLLQASGIIYLLEPYFSNTSKRMVKKPKLYFLDTGLCAYLTEWLSPETLEAGAMSGAFFETWVLGELLKSYWHNGLRAPFYYYRDKDQKEVDLLIIRDGILYPLEFKKSASPGKKEARNFQSMEKLRMPLGPGGVISLAEQFLPLTSTVHAIPVAAL